MAAEMSTASAPAKVMLFGEYAVLEGAPALALALNRRIEATARRGPRSVVRSGLLPNGALEVDLSGPLPHPVLRFVWPLLQQAGEGIELDFVAGFPAVWGLGSSSASTLAAAAALRALTGRSVAPDVLFGEVLDRQRTVQGAASGYDAATQIIGGCALFRPTDPPTLERPAPAAESWSWVVAWTGDKVSTGAMIRSVRTRHPRGAPIYDRIGRLAEDALALLVAADQTAVGAALNEGQGLLEELGASPDWASETTRAIAASPGVLGARLAGAGGGDCIVSLVDDREAAVAAIEAAGLTPLDLEVDPIGLRVEGSH